MKKAHASWADSILTHSVHRLQPVHNPRDDMPSLSGGVPHSDGRVHLVRALQRAHVAPDVAQNARGRGFSLAAATLNASVRYFAAFVFIIGTWGGTSITQSWIASTCAQTQEKSCRYRAGEYVCCFDVDLDSGASAPPLQPSASVMQHVAHLLLLLVPLA